jgi:hypothetical protein
MAKLTKRYMIHDENASRDVKVLKMREKYGARGYGLFWEIVEYLFSVDGKAELNAKVVSFAIGEDIRAVRAFLSDCIEVYQLFESDGTFFWSKRLLSQIDRIISISEQRSMAGRKRHNRKSDNSKQIKELDSIEIEKLPSNCSANAKQLNSNCSAINKINRINEIDSNCRERKQPIKFSKPSIEEIEAYCIERENTVNPIQFFDYYEANGWRVGKNPMKDWKAAVRTWERNDSGGKKSKVFVQNDPYAELR